ncbi:DNA polymerase gamma, mitochondrial [Neonectria ditissima]|uniref:DNA-directed DNA polymerase n=1 Tax=Neonectria ditissima TaxID=78410 RepID=A0A0P7BAD3_9HYPO|nr:DNA polymerase gamma, mitochondrial [Neonectria ditissima]
MLSSAAGHIQRGSTASFIRIARHQTFRRHAWRAHVRWLSAVADTTELKRKSSLALPSQARHNEIGVQQLSSHVFDQIFPDGSKPAPPELVKLSRDHLRRHDLLGKNTDNSDPIAFDLPPLQGDTLDEHFHRLGMDSAEPYLSLAKQFAQADPLPKPREWVRRSGWTKYYSNGEPEQVDAPDETMLCFDTEVMWKVNPFAVMACASSPTAWYAWLSPWLLGETENERQLIPLGDPTKDRIIVGHNVGYDRARILEEYDIKQTRNTFMDTMSLHVAVNGMCSQQRPTWMKHKKNRESMERVASETQDYELAALLSSNGIHDEEELWVERSSVNSLRDVAKFHLNVTIDKTIRNDFGELDRDCVLEKLDELINYCADDVSITHRIYQIVFPNFLQVCPHPVSFAALRHVSSVILPVNKSWDDYLTNAEATYQKLSDAILERLVGLTEKALEVKDDAEKYQNDPWLQQLDWSGQEIRMVKGKRKNDPPRPAARQKKPGMPKWYKDLFAKNDAPISVTVRTRVAPLLLRLCWDSHPLFWSDKYGWTFRVPRAEMEKYIAKQMVECVFDEKEPVLRDDLSHAFFKLPHKDGPNSRCTNPMAKGYLAYFENGTLSSEYSYAKEALEMNASCSYWISARDRIKSQMVVYEEDLIPDESKDDKSSVVNNNNNNGFILPQIIPMGTITRRSVENTWLTASNAKKNRVGSELKAMVKAPEGYSFVGADVDSEELWIASLVGDATFKLHGGNAVGFMTLEGTKAAGTDLHSRTAGILGITRNNAKIFNYGRIYGAGLKFASTLLRQFNPNLSEKETTETASKLYVNTKGTKTNRKTLYKRPFWRGGTESFVFNKLEEFAEQDRPRTPVLGAGITEALMGQYINRGGYLTSRINWAIQSSGVDYLHLLIVAMDYLTRRFSLDARLSITVHDEIRYLVKNEDRYRAAMALQVANIWTRAMFAQQVGINDLPQSCAYFSAVDIDHVLRKEVDMKCITPSHPDAIAPGESIDIVALLEKGNEARLDPAIVPDPKRAPKLDHIQFTPRVPVMQAIRNTDGESIPFLKAQIASNDQELRDIIKDVAKAKMAVVGKKERPLSKKSLQKVLPYHDEAHMMMMDAPIPVSEAMSERYSHGYKRKENQWQWASNTAKGVGGPSSRL